MVPNIALVSYQTFLLLLGSVFVPLFAVLLAGSSYDREDVFAAVERRKLPALARAQR